ncbi:MAG: sigma-70 family RNA polymerase sigma factor [Nitrospirota bacterium]
MVKPDLDFDRIFNENVDRLFAFGQRICGHVEDAKDLVQETFLNAYQSLDGFRGEAKISTWLYTIAARVCIRKRRKKKDAPDRELSLEEFLPGEGDIRLQPIADGLDPEQALQNEQLKNVLEGAIQALPKRYRLVLVLRDMEGLSAREVGSIMGLNERAVKSRLHRARLFMRTQLAHKGIHGAANT